MECAVPIWAALESLGKPRFSIGQIPPTPVLVDQYFNDSTGQGADGEIDVRGPWNEGDAWEFVTAPAFQDLQQADREDEPAVDERGTSSTPAPEMVQDLLVELQDLLHAEGQLVKASSSCDEQRSRGEVT